MATSLPMASKSPHAGEPMDRYQRLVSRISGIVFELDASGSILFVNECIAKVTGYDPGELKGRNLWSIFCPGELHDRVNDLYTRFQSGDVTNYEIIVLGKNGQQIVLQLNSANVYQLDGTLDRVIGLAMDITMRKRSEDEHQHLLEIIREENQRTEAAELEARRFAAELEAIFVAITNPVIIYNAQNIVVRANPATLAALGFNPVGYRPLDVIRKLDFRYPDGRPATVYELPVTRAQNGVTSISNHFIFTDQAGNSHSILASASPLFENSENSGVVVIWNDITELERAGTLLAEREGFNRAVLNSLTSHIAVVDKLGIIIATNEAWDHFAQEIGDPFLIQTAIDSNHLPITGSALKTGDTDAEKALRGLQNVLGGSAKFFSLEYPCQLPNRRLWFLMRVTPLAGTSGGAVISHTNITDQKLAEEAVKNSEKHFRSLIERSADGLSLVSRDGVILFTSPAADRIWGPSTSHVVGQQFFGNIHPDDRPRCIELLHNLVAQPDLTVEGTFRVMHPDNNWRWIEVSAANLLNEPSVQAIVVNYRDITERKQAEEQLQQYATRLKGQHEIDEAILAARSLDEINWSVLRHVVNLVPCQGANITLFDFEKREFKVFSSSDHAKDMSTREKHVPFDAMGNIDSYLDRLRQGQTILTEDTRTLQSSSIIQSAIVEGSYTLLSSPLLSWGSLIGTLNLWSDQPESFKTLAQPVIQEVATSLALAITQARLFTAMNDYNRILEETVQQRTMEVNRAKDHLEAIFNNSGDAIIVTDINGLIEQTNLAFRNLFGYRIGDTLNNPIGILVGPHLGEVLTDSIQTAVKESRLIQLEISAQHNNGTAFDAEISLSPIIEQDGSTSEVVCSLRDITAHKQVERELKELNQLKTEFLSTAAHELRTPLTTIRGFSELLLTRQLETGRQKHFLSLINQQSTQLGHLLDDLLDISRLEAKRTLALNLEAIDVTQLLREVALLFEESATSHPIKIHELASPFTILGDPFRLSQVVKNLISNAIKYSPQGSEINISTQQREHFIEVSVQDQGIGMTADQQAHLFEKFYRADASNTAISGTGLGLSICKSIVELHGGHIRVESEYRHGSTFYFTLPSSQHAPQI
jgi:PAS domain S-box-containing protein